MAERHRLRTLEVRVPGHHRLRLGLREREDDERECVDRLARLRARVEHVQAERGCDLVVARPPGVDLPPDVAEQPLDRRVHVLVGVEVPVRILCDLGQARLRPRRAPRPSGGPPPRDASRARTSPRSRTAGARRRRRAGSATRRGRERSRPGLPTSSPGDYALLAARALAAWSSVSSDETRMKPSAASCGNVSPVPYDASSARRSCAASAGRSRPRRSAAARAGPRPLTSSCVASTKASIASRAGLNQRPS